MLEGTCHGTYFSDLFLNFDYLDNRQNLLNNYDLLPEYIPIKRG